ncbi:recombinase family protein [Acutalibacter muris]|uniref:Recombinase family protein n=1 Tax=Acutalibacter muris TaxID=1796620 RepID=A0A1Z2XSE3_9FIRM|nr:recombinase family protein [Acutalibacter muris]ANU55389.1 hypothetical protein A4V00_15975 [Hungateiclostridiaceae bacterium KB18]ASB41376.1 hypothetical protein ADH66_12345 [Acutalibacter muris]QQR30638.1 recombinase family protein [Acutalibacter muris]
MTVAIYLRLSGEDNDGVSEFESISNQRNLLLHHIHNMPDFFGANVAEFCDDGWSGKNFDRPAVKELLEQAKRGEIQCIMVKDLSRFGRDYITVGNYITRVFPFLNVRFIAVNDHFDSSRREDIYSLGTSFRALIYDMYSRDASKKVKTAKQRLAKRGVNINPVAPFGYMKDPKDRHRLIPDPKTADVVRKIFSLVADGNSIETTARILNCEGIAPPSRSKKDTSSEHANWCNEHWNTGTIYTILRDRQYIGCFVYGKRVRPQIGAHQQLTADFEDRIVVEDCHEPLVSKGLFEAVQERLGKQKHEKHVMRNDPLSKKVICGVCGYAIVPRGQKERYYLCQRPRTVPGLGCYGEKILESDILAAVSEAILQQARLAADLAKIAVQQTEMREKQAKELRQKLQECRAEQEILSAEITKLYEGYVDGRLTKPVYSSQKAVLMERLEQARDAEKDLSGQSAVCDSGDSEFIDKYRELADTEVLTKERIGDLLERVTVFPGGRLEIKLRFLDGNSAAM